MFIVMVKKVNCTPFVVFSCLPLLSGISKTSCSSLPALALVQMGIWRGGQQRRGRVVTPGVIIRPD